MNEQRDDSAVIVSHLVKSFKIPIEAHSGIKQRLINLLKGRKGYRKFTPLDDISFTIEKGEFFGIVGRNGSGKSTLLKSIAGIYSPNGGEVHVAGKLVPFIELGVGFNPELTGRENVFLNGALLGFSRSEVESMYSEIVDFAELHDFMEERLKNYSSGMQVRLAFSIAIRAQGDILLLDEVLAVGDEAFQRKCFDYFAKLKKENKTVILVTHDMNSVARFCTKALLLDKGKIISFGDVKHVVAGYEKLNERVAQSSQAPEVAARSTYGDIVVSLNSQSADKDIIVNASENKLIFDIEITSKATVENVFFGFTIQKSSGELVYWYSTEEDGNVRSIEKEKPQRLRIVMQNIYGNGEYSVNVSVKKSDRSKDYIVVRDAIKFSVTGRHRTNGWMFHPDVEVEVINQ